MEKDKNVELEKILSELNSSIQKGAKEKESGENPEGEAGKPAEEGKDSFVRRATVIEPPGDGEKEKKPVKHIAVTAVEVIEDEPPEKTEEEPPEPPRPLKKKPPQKLPHPSELPPISHKKRPRMSRREKWTAVFGLFTTLFVIIGIVSTVVGAVNLTKGIVNSTAQKQEFERYIFPLVIVDVPEFETPQALDNSAIISSAIWAFIIDDNDKSQYAKDDFGGMTVPDVDIEPYIRKLYGNDIKIVHQNAEDTSVQMMYDPESKSYQIETTPKFLPYTPRVDKINRSKDIYTLTVSYVLPDALWNLNPSHDTATVDKVMEYKLQKTKTGYQILSVKLVSVNTGETASDVTSSAVLPEEPGPESSEETPVNSSDAASK